MTRSVIWDDNTVPVLVERLDDGWWRVARAGTIVGEYRTKAAAFRAAAGDEPAGEHRR
jgi:hypothetical protein